MARFTLTRYLIRCKREHRVRCVPGYSANSGSFLVANEFFKVT
jgi:hypothetical protein